MKTKKEGYFEGENVTRKFKERKRRFEWKWILLETEIYGQ